MKTWRAGAARRDRIAQREAAFDERHVVRRRAGLREDLGVVRGVPRARGVPGLEVAELHAQHRRLERVEARVHADHAVPVLAASCRARAACGCTSATSASWHVTRPPSPKPPRFFVGKKLKHASGPAEPTRRPRASAAPIACAASSIDRHAEPRAERDEPFEVDRLPEEVDRQDRLEPRAAARGALHVGDGRVEGRRVDVREDRLGAEPRDTARGREERVGRADHLVAGPDPVRHQREEDRVAAGADGDRLGRAAVVGELALERVDLGAQDELLRLHDARERGADLGAQLVVLRPQIEQRHLDALAQAEALPSPHRTRTRDARPRGWRRVDSNHRPTAYETAALTD